MQLLANTLKQILSYLAPAFFLTLAGLAHGDALFNVAEIAPVLDKHPCKTTCKVQENASDYTLTPVDLNGDGRYEYLVKSEADCGSGGCAQGLFIRGNTGWVKLVENQGDMVTGNSPAYLFTPEAYAKANAADCRRRVVSTIAA